MKDNTRNLSDTPTENQSETKISRRSVVMGMLPLIAAAGLSGRTTAQAQSAPVPSGDSTFPGLITREKEPMNLEFPFPTLDNVITPNNRFYVRNHFSVPKLDATAWRLSIDGAVNKQISLSYDELRRLPSVKVTATLECAGNSRANLVPKAKGVLWEQGGISNAEWTGVPLSVLLDRAGIKSGAMEAIFEGADSGEVKEEPKSPGVISFARSLPLAKARRGEVIVAYQMNGKNLPPEHGYPARLVVPGWYGMASVKWLKKITLTTTPFDGYWQTLEYAYWKKVADLPTLVPVTETEVKAEIARPNLSEAVKAGSTYRVHGAAWTGESEVAKVEFSADEGKTWNAARLLGEAVPFAWRLWEFNWTVPPAAGKYKLMARATDKKGNIQPASHDPNRRTYMINFTAPVEVTVE